MDIHGMLACSLALVYRLSESGLINPKYSTLCEDSSSSQKLGWYSNTPWQASFGLMT